MGTRALLILLGIVTGAPVGGMIGLFGGFGLAAALGVGAEATAYLRLFVIVPACMLSASFAAATALWAVALEAEKKGARLKRALFLASPLALVLVAGVIWQRPGRSAEFRVRNDCPQPLEDIYLGHDHRRATRLDTIGPGETTAYHGVDLDARGSFNAVRGRYAGDNLTLTPALEVQETLQGERFTYRVHCDGARPSFELQSD